VLDAYCPHLGADIAVGGTVIGDCVILSFTVGGFGRDRATT